MICEITNLSLFCLSVCPYGFFGRDCAKKCNETCLGCNNINGSCDFGCIQGWRGYYCHEGDDIAGRKFNMFALSL